MANGLDAGYGAPNRGLSWLKDLTPISLYFDIEKGRHADLEVVARTAIEWAAIIRELATIVAPGVNFDIELVKTEDGSLWLSNLLKAAREGDRKALAAIVWAVLAFFAMGPALHLQTDTGDKVLELFGHKDFAELSEADKEDIAKKVAQAVEATAAPERRQKMIREVEKDETIKGVGVDRTPKTGGAFYVIRRDQFPFYASDIGAKVAPPIKNTNYRNSVRVKIVRANLKEGEAKPRWRFGEGETEWSADIEDAEFVHALNAQATGLLLAVGQIMVVDVAIDVKSVDGAWEESNRRIIRVVHPPLDRQQRTLDLGG